MTSRLALRRSVPGFSLPSSRGVALGPRDFRHRKNLVLFVAHDLDCAPCREMLAELAARYDDFRELNAEVMAVVGNPPDDVAGAPYPFPVLSDADGRVREIFLHERLSGDDQVAFFITDRFGQLYMQTVASVSNELPRTPELLDWLNYIEMQCPECGAPEWPEEE